MVLLLQSSPYTSPSSTPWSSERLGFGVDECAQKYVTHTGSWRCGSTICSACSVTPRVPNNALRLTGTATWSKVFRFSCG